VSHIWRPAWPPTAYRESPRDAAAKQVLGTVMSDVKSHSTGVGPSNSLEVPVGIELHISTVRSSEPVPLPARPP